MEKEFISIQRDGDIYTIKEVGREFAQGQQGKITKNNFVIKKNTDRYNRLISIVKEIPTTGKYRKLVTLINDLYGQFNDKHPNWVTNPTIPLNVVNENIALVVTKDIIKSVYANNIRSSKTRVHIDGSVAQEFLRTCGGELKRESVSQDTWNYWEDKARYIFKNQIDKVLILNKEVLKHV